MTNLKSFIPLYLLICFSSLSFAETQVEKIEALRIKRYFTSQAKKIINKLESSKNSSSTLFQLSKNISPKNIEISIKDLVDNRGSLVDAIGVPSKVTLDKKRWASYIGHGTNLDLLILHELYRMAGIDDDNFQRSLPMYSVLITNKTKKIFCDLNKEKFEYIYKFKNVHAEGIKAMNTDGGLLITPETSRELYLIAWKNAKRKCEEKGYKEGMRDRNIVTNNIYTSGNSNGYKYGYMKSEIYVRCKKRVIDELSNREIKKRFCTKINSCIKRIRDIDSKGINENHLHKVVNLKEQEEC
jgi:hypothetical protein